MSEKITYGIKNVHVARLTRSVTGAVTFAPPKKLAGASEITLSTVGDPLEVYADNITYFKQTINQGYNGNLSIYKIPDWFYEEYLGHVRDENGVLVEDSSAQIGEFALMFEFNTDRPQTKRNVFYNCTAARPEISSKTKEKAITPTLLSLPITASPDEQGYVRATVTGDASDAAWGSWFSSVYTPKFAAAFAVDITVADTAGALVVCGDKFAYTDETGRARFMMHDGEYNVYVACDGKTATADVSVSGAAVNKTVTLQ